MNNKIKGILLALLLCSTSQLYGQNLAGNWVGKLYQNDIDWYDFEINLTYDGDSNTYIGTSHIRNENGSGILALTATFKLGILHFQETKVKEEYWKTMGWHWSMKNGDLKLSNLNDSLVLAGTWQGIGTWKGSGTLRLAKMSRIQEKLSTISKMPARKIETKEKLQITENEILGEIWDNENEDGDIASISLNGIEILKKHLVTIKKHQFHITLQPGKNMLVLFAENLGTRPPNTAAITIHYDGKTKTVVLNSDKSKSEAIEINH